MAGSVSSWVRAAGAAARASQKKRKNPPQSKADLAAKFNKRVESFIMSGLDPETLPNKITDYDAFTHRELRKLVSSATLKKSSGVYQHGQYLMTEFRRSYEDAMIEIINDRRATRKKIIEKLPAYAGGQPADAGIVGRMGSIRDNYFRPLKKGSERKFATVLDETYFMRKLPEMLQAEAEGTLRDNMVYVLKKTYGDKANHLIAQLLKASPDQILKAWYSEELFDIVSIYESETNEGVGDGILKVLSDTMKRITGENAKTTKATKEKADQIFIAHETREAAAVKERMLGGNYTLL